MQHPAQLVGFWSLEVQRLHRAELRRVRRRMWRARFPLNEKWNQRRGLLDAKRLPAQQLAVRTLPRTGLRPSGLDAAGLGGTLGGRDVLSVDRPLNDARRRKLSQPALVGRIGLCRVGRDDLEVVACAERKQRISRTTSGMIAAELRAHSRA